MTDTNAGGWPDADKPGVPMHPERDGWHWLAYSNTGETTCRKWHATWQGRLNGWWEGATNTSTPEKDTRGLGYLGPCLTPQEVAAREAAAWCAAMSLAKARVRGWWHLHEGERIAADLDKLTPPAELAAALEAVRREAVTREREALAEWHVNNARLLRDATMQSLPAMPSPIICRDRAQVHEDSAAAIRARGTEDGR